MVAVEITIEVPIAIGLNLGAQIAKNFGWKINDR
jgi:hypothetical protein